jgi:peptide/nickel transport system ATP-binding protein
MIADLAARPGAEGDATTPRLSLTNVSVRFAGLRGRDAVMAVSDVSLSVMAGQTLGLVGESGCGKSSLARAIMQLPPPVAGQVRLDGTDLTALRGESLRAARSRMHLIFQDPISSLNPRRSVARIVAEPAVVWNRASGQQLRELVDRNLEAVGLDPAATRDRRPRQFSGGQCQRICIARALILEPDLVICDEPVSALDVSIQAQILNLLERLRRERGLTMIFISHDLAVVKNVSDKIAVMYLGRICEMADSETLYRRPAHPYTRALIDSIPTPEPRATGRQGARLAGDLPSAARQPSGCRFRTRCPRAEALCAKQEPALLQVAPGHTVACHFPLTVATGGGDHDTHAGAAR